jgi:hypothetical protein
MGVAQKRPQVGDFVLQRMPRDASSALEDEALDILA